VPLPLSKELWGHHYEDTTLKNVVWQSLNICSCSKRGENCLDKWYYTEK
jgi:hypothetical protein